MPRREFKLDSSTVVLPRGTRVTLRTDLRGDDGYLHKTASVATVRDVAHHTYSLETPSGRTLSAQRDQIALQREDLLGDLGHRQWEFRKLEGYVIYAATVGSHAWGLADEHSDVDVRGCFVAPFEEWAGLWDMPGEIRDPTGEAAYWEVEKLVEQGLRGDANTLETLWSPLPTVVTELGEELVRRRRMFVSMNILGSFGRYAQSQFKKIERSLLRNEAICELLAEIERGAVSSIDEAAALLHAAGVAPSESTARKEVHATCRSLFDRGLIDGVELSAVMRAVADGRRADLEPAAHRPKNAYNLLRLLHSCIHWLREGDPLIRVDGALRDELLAIKTQQMAIEDVLVRAREVALEVEEAARRATLPEHPDYEAADSFLKQCRRRAADESVHRSPAKRARLLGDSPELIPTVLPEALPPDIDIPALRRFLTRYVDQSSPEHCHMLWLAVTGSHAYGFASPDSDLDLKGIHVEPAQRVLGLSPPAPTIEFLDHWEGREFDFSCNELAQAARLLLGGNGNVLERLLGPLNVVITRAGRQLAALARGSLSKRLHNHYGGFFRGMLREYRLESPARAKRLLYAYRVALTGVHALLTAEIVVDVRPLAREYGFERVGELIAIKARGENATLDGEAARPYEEDLSRLEATLGDALSRSSLPDDPPNADAIERFVIAERLRAGDGLPPAI